jgi:hypothetical protein
MGWLWLRLRPRPAPTRARASPCLFDFINVIGYFSSRAEPEF